VRSCVPAFRAQIFPRRCNALPYMECACELINKINCNMCAAPPLLPNLVGKQNPLIEPLSRAVFSYAEEDPRQEDAYADDDDEAGALLPARRRASDTEAIRACKKPSVGIGAGIVDSNKV
jgi:hypothetical protein